MLLISQIKLSEILLATENKNSCEELQAVKMMYARHISPNIRLVPPSALKTVHIYAREDPQESHEGRVLPRTLFMLRELLTGA